MRENSFYPPTPPPGGLARPTLAVPGPFQGFSHSPPRLQGYQRPQSQVETALHNSLSSLKMFLQRQEVGKDGKLLTKAALTMPRDLSSSHLNQNFRLGFMQVGGGHSG